MSNENTSNGEMLVSEKVQRILSKMPVYDYYGNNDFQPAVTVTILIENKVEVRRHCSFRQYKDSTHHIICIVCMPVFVYNVG